MLVIAAFCSAFSCERSVPAPDVAWHPFARIVSGDARYDQGVSAMYAASAGDMLLIAGGANFPDVPAADGGKKAFYDYIYMYNDGWRCVGRLPEPAAYGVGCSFGRGVLFAGGANEGGALQSVYMIEIEGDEATVTARAPLPCAVEQAAGTSIEDRVYLFGGVADGRPSSSLFVLDMSDSGAEWQRLASAPEPMVQPVAAASGGRLYVWGGFDSATKRVSSSGYCYDPQRDEWSVVAGHPDDGTFTGASAVTLVDGRILCTGGVDREIFAAALQLPAEKVRGYQMQPPEYYRFQRMMYLFDPVSGEWSRVGESECTARAGASLVCFGDGVCLLGGELKPGIRTPDNFYTADILY